MIGLRGSLILSLCAVASAAAAPDNASVPVRVLWRTALEPANHSPIVGKSLTRDRLFVASSALRAYAQDSGQLLWTAPLRKYVPRDVVVARRLVYSAESSVSALDSQSGATLWNFLPDDNASLGQATADHRNLYFGTASHHLYAVRLSDGKRLWMDSLGQDWQYPAVIRGITNENHVLYVAIEQWRTRNGTSASGWLIAIDSKSGRIRWQFSTGTGTQREGFSSAPAITSRLVIGNDYLSNQIVAVDRHSGKEVWRFRGEPGFVGFPETPIVSRDVVYVGSGDTWVYALRASDGQKIWQMQMPAANEGYAMCGSTLLVTNGQVTAMDPGTGAVLQTLVPDSSDYTVFSLTAAKNRAFVAGNRVLYALGCS